jgi:hypothetical protein
MDAKVKKTNGFDRMSLTAKFPSGASLKFSVGRSGDRLELAFSNDSVELKKQMKIVSKWLDFQGDEKNQDRFDRLEALCMKCKSGAEFMANIK